MELHLLSMLILLLLPLLCTTTTTPIPPHPISPTATPSLPPHRISPTTSPSPTKSPSVAASTLDPKQLTALQSLNIPTTRDPCAQPSLRCDAATPFRHLLSLRLANCSDDLSLSPTALRSLSTLQDLAFLNCPLRLVRLPAELTSNLRVFTCINSLTRVTGVWLGRLRNLTDLSVSHVPIKASGPQIIIGNMKKLTTVSITDTNLTGHLPRKWSNFNLSSIDLSTNKLIGHIPSSITLLENLQHLNLSSNSLSGVLPDTIGDLLSLQNLSLASNSISGAIPESLGAIRGLLHLDLSSNQLNGSIPKFISGMKKLKYLNLENNNFDGVMPFNASFIKKMVVFKIGGNSGLCYNHTTISSKLKLGVAQCDKYGLPVSPPPDRSSDSSGEDNGDEDDTADDDASSNSTHKEGGRHGPSKVVLGVAIGLSSLVFLIVLFILLLKWCK